MTEGEKAVAAEGKAAAAQQAAAPARAPVKAVGQGGLGVPGRAFLGGSVALSGACWARRKLGLPGLGLGELGLALPEDLLGVGKFRRAQLGEDFSASASIRLGLGGCALAHKGIGEADRVSTNGR